MCNIDTKKAVRAKIIIAIINITVLPFDNYVTCDLLITFLSSCHGLISTPTLVWTAQSIFLLECGHKDTELYLHKVVDTTDHTPPTA